jgi:hypothetical protein
MHAIILRDELGVAMTRVAILLDETRLPKLLRARGPGGHELPLAPSIGKNTTRNYCREENPAPNA